MHVSPRLSTAMTRLRPTVVRRGSRSEALAPQPPVLRDSETARVREAGGPVDLASYTCSCGMVFRAPVSASVRCPHCGGAQDW